MPVSRKTKTSNPRLSGKYLETHTPDREFEPRDFERVTELALFGWETMRRVVAEAQKHPDVKPNQGPKKLTVTLSFEIEQIKVRQPDGVLVPMCIGAKFKPGAHSLGPGDGSHQPCMQISRARAYHRHEK